MARYFFHIDNGHPHHDEMGEDHPHDASAWQAALRMVSDVEGRLNPGQAWLLEVHEGNEPVYLISITTRQRRPVQKAANN